MSITMLPDGVTIEQTDAHVHVEFSRPHRVLSSAVLNGGLVEADRILNLKVPKQCSAPLEDPAVTLSRYSSRRNWRGLTVGMMTAASMSSLRTKGESSQGVDITVLVTSGLSNARRAGDRAEFRRMDTDAAGAGTINIVALTNAAMTGAAMAEALMIATEAKVIAVQSLGISSPVSGDLATGTGTDCTAIVCGQASPLIRYCGKHVLFGEILAKLVIETVTSSLRWGIDHDG